MRIMTCGLVCVVSSALAPSQGDEPCVNVVKMSQLALKSELCGNICFARLMDPQHCCILQLARSKFAKTAVISQCGV